MSQGRIGTDSHNNILIVSQEVMGKLPPQIGDSTAEVGDAIPENIDMEYSSWSSSKLQSLDLPPPGNKKYSFMTVNNLAQCSVLDTTTGSYNSPFIQSDFPLTMDPSCIQLTREPEESSQESPPGFAHNSSIDNTPTSFLTKVGKPCKAKITKGRSHKQMQHSKIERDYRCRLSGAFEILRRNIQLFPVSLPTRNRNPNDQSTHQTIAQIEELKPSKGVILDRATEYISQMRRHQNDLSSRIEELRERIQILERITNCDECPVWTSVRNTHFAPELLCTITPDPLGSSMDMGVG